MSTGAKLFWGVAATCALFLTLLLVLEVTGTWDRSAPDPSPAAECTDSAAVGENWINCDAREFVEMAVAEQLFYDQARGIDKWANVAGTDLDLFAASVCEALDGHAAGDRQHVIDAVAEDCGLHPSDAATAVDAAVQYRCPRSAR